MLRFLSCLSFHPGNPDSSIFRALHYGDFFRVEPVYNCQHLDSPDSMILRIFRCCGLYPVYPSILEILIHPFSALSTMAISSGVRPYNKYTI